MTTRIEIEVSIMAKKLKVMTVVGTRPELIRLSRIIAKLDIHCDQILVHTGQNYDYELNEIFFSDLEIRKPDIFLAAAGKTGAQTIGNVIIKVDEVLEEQQPDLLLVLGDTNSCMSVLPAKRKKIPVFHMEAGNRCFDMRVPEEINRKIVDHIADVNLTYSSISRDYLINEGLPPQRIIKTGSPMAEVLSFHQEDINKSNVLKRLKLKPENYFVISAHREEIIECSVNIRKLANIINQIAEVYNLPVIMSFHPRTSKRFESENISVHENVCLLKPLGFFDYNHLQMNAKAVLSDSGTITEEASILNFRAINLRDTHERPEGMEQASVMMVGLNFERTMQCLEILKNQPVGAERLLNKVPDYQDTNVSDKIIRILHSYCDYVNKDVWKRY